MTKSVFNATDPAGTVHKRSTARTYTHTVVIRLGDAYAERLLASRIKEITAYAPKGYDFHLSMTDGRWQADTDAKYPGLYDAAHWVEEKAHHSAILAGRTQAQYCADELARVKAEHAAQVAAGNFSTWINVGWCGRPDLANKLASAPQPYTQFGGPAEARILEAEKVK